MAERISRDELGRRMAEAQETYAKEMQAADGDSGKGALATSKLRWAEDAAKEAFNHRSVLYRFFDSVPVLGKPIAILLDAVEMGIAEHGLVLGLSRGLLVGTILAVALALISEGAIAAFEVVRQGVLLDWTSGLITGQRTHAIDQIGVLRKQRVYHRGRAATISSQFAYYAFDELLANAHIVDGGSLTSEELEALDPNVFRRGSHVLTAGTAVSPFFHYYEASNVYLLEIKTPIVRAAHQDIATLADPESKTQYVIAAGPDDMLILIRLRDYQAAGLPMHEDTE